MSDPESDLSEAWLKGLANIDAQLAAGESLSLEHLPPELVDAGKVLQDLRRFNVADISQTHANMPAERNPEKIGRYVLDEVIGVGGCAIVYRAWDEDLRRDVAIKIPLPNQLLREANRKRFVQEAQAAARLDHPHIVKAYEAGVEGTLPYIVYAYCPGPTLAQWIKNHGPLRPVDAAQMLRSLAEAVEYSHKLGVLHRDLKPSNVLLYPTREEGKTFPYQPKLTDFGFAKFLEEAASLSCSSVIVGTPLYVTPEQLNSPNREPNVTTDVFGLGSLLFEALTAVPPCQGESLVEVLDRIRSGNYDKLRSRRNLPVDLASICDKALAFDPTDRYPSVEQMTADLGRFLRGESVLACRPNLLRRAKLAVQSTQRIREAAGFMILSNMAMLLWITAWPIAIFFDLSIASGATNRELIPYTAPLVLLHLVFIGLGRQISNTKGWAAGFGTMLSLVLVVFQVAILAAWITPPYPTIYPNARTRDIVFSLLLCLFMMQFILSGCAWLAIRYKRSRER